MKDLSVAQEYMLCTLNEKGKFPLFSTEIPVCFLASGLLELLSTGCIEINEKNKICVTGNLGESNFYLNSLYNWLKDSKPRSVEDIASEYLMSFTGKRLATLINDVEQSLADTGCVVSKKNGLRGNTLLFIPNPYAVDYVIQKIRAELLEQGPVSDETIALVSLMHKSNQIKRYFSEYESNLLNNRLKEVKKTATSQLVNQMVDYIDTMIVMFAANSIL